jgi:Na+-driven multidrug efflux pump
MVGMVSISALAAVGMSMQFMMIINVLMTLYVVGGNALISRFIGQGRKKRASALLYALGIFAVVLSVFVTIGVTSAVNIFIHGWGLRQML